MQLRRSEKDPDNVTDEHPRILFVERAIYQNGADQESERRVEAEGTKEDDAFVSQDRFRESSIHASLQSIL